MPPQAGGPGAAAPITTCMLLIGDRVVLRANAPPEAEYLLFEIADIELRASEPGRVREHGYQTTVERARQRLQQLGITAAFARECAVAMHPVLATAYARGPGVRHVARYLGPLELFQADTFDAGSQTYRGVFIDLPTLVGDLEMPGAGSLVQALYLAALLEGEAEDTTIFLSTDAWTKHRKPGERTHKRPSLAATRPLSKALADLAGHNPQPNVREQLARADVIAFVRARADSSPDDEDACALYASLERAVAVRDAPDRGPLADPELWAIETRLDTDNLENILEAVEEVERTRGRTPGTTYLRARASLALHLEPPRLIAERVSALALSMTSFQELCLLAAEAWLDAGDARRAMPYARDLVDAPGVDEGLLLRAKRLLARAVGAAPDKHKTYADSMPAAPLPPSQFPKPPSMPPISAPDFNTSQSWPPAKSRIPTERGDQAPSVPPPLPSRARSQAVDAPPRANSSGPPPFAPAGGPPPLPRKSQAPPLPTSYKLPPRAPSLSAPPPPPPPPAPPRPPSSPRAMPARSHAPPRMPPERAPSRAPPLPGPAARPARAPEAKRARRSDAPPPGPISSMPAALRQRPESASVLPSAPPPPIDLDLPPPPADASASFTLDLPGPETLPETQDAGGPGPAPSARAEDSTTASQRPSRRRSMGVVSVETRAPPAYDPRAEPDSTEPETAARTLSGRTSRKEISDKETLRGKALEESRWNARSSDVPPPPRLPNADAHARPTPMRPPSPRPPPPSAREAMRTPVLDAELPVESTAHVARTLEREKDIQRHGSSAPPPAYSMHGASLPPYRLENPPPLLAKAPLMPKLGGAADELVEHLPLPAGLGNDPRSYEQALPKSVLEARVAFTLLARELGLDYRLKRGIELRADVSGLEAMQSVLLESFPDHLIRTSDDAYELRRHGALLSEILARRFEAEWIDISPNELGYWAMIVPPDTRVWPFARIARLIEMGHRERDLVSFFFEVQGRARGR